MKPCHRAQLHNLKHLYFVQLLEIFSNYRIRPFFLFRLICEPPFKGVHITMPSIVYITQLTGLYITFRSNRKCIQTSQAEEAPRKVMKNASRSNGYGELSFGSILF